MRIRLLSLASLALVWLALPAAAAADCELPGPIEEELSTAALAFVGTVVSTNGPTATVAVREQWIGGVADTVELRGMGPDPGTFSEDDREWTVGQRYLFLPILHEGAIRDNICTATTPWTPELEALRPADARIVEAEPGRPEAPPVPIELLAVAAFAALIVGVGILAFRRR